MPLIDQQDAIRALLPENESARPTAMEDAPTPSGDNAIMDKAKAQDAAGDQSPTPLKDVNSNTRLADMMHISNQANAAEDITKAAFSENNPVGSAVQYGIGRPGSGETRDPGYNPFDDIKGSPYAQYPLEFADSPNHMDTVQRMQNIDTHIKNTQELEHGGFTANVANLSAGIISPINAIPVFGQEAAGAKLLTGALKGLGYGAAYGATLGASTEAGIALTGQPMTKDRPYIANTLASAVVAGTFGAAIGFANTSVIKYNQAITKSILEDGKPPETDAGLPKLGSVGADVTDISPNTLAHLGSPKVAKAITSMLQPGSVVPGKIADQFRTPVWTGANSESPFVRDLNQKIWSFNGTMEKNTAKHGFQTTDIALDEHYDQVKQQANNFTNQASDIYAKYLERNGGTTSKIKSFFNPSMNKDLMSREEFYSDASIARWDQDPTAHEPEVWELQGLMGKHLDDNTALLKEHGLLEEDVTPREKAYLSLIWDPKKVSANRQQFEQMVTEGHIREGKRPDEAANLASDAADKVVGYGDVAPNMQQYTHSIINKQPGFLKDRTIPVNAIDAQDFLKLNGVNNTASYIKQSGLAVGLKKLLDGYGVDSVNDLAKLVDQEANLHPELNLGGEVAEKNKQLVKDSIDIMTGQYARKGAADSALSYLQAYTYLQDMGSVVFTGITHTAAPVFKYGVGPYIMNGWVKLATMASETRAAKFEDMEKAGMVTGRMMNNLLKDIVDPTFTDGFASKGQQVTANAMHYFGKATLMEPLVEGSRQAVTLAAETQVMEDLRNFSNLDDATREHLAKLHINQDNYKAILQQADKYGDSTKGIANYDLWDNQEAKVSMIAALNKEVNTYVPKATKGDITFLQNRYQWAKNVFQFTSFFQALTSKLLIPGMQQRDMKTLQGIIAVSTLGSLSYVAKCELKGEKPDLSPDNLLMQGVYRSALMGLFTTHAIGAIMDKTGYKTTDYKDQSPLLQFLGPGAETVDKAVSLGNRLWDGKFDRQSARQAWSLMPAHNFWLLQGLMTLMHGNKQ